MKKTASKKIIFIYNADSGVRNMVLDSMHKVFSPSTYECKLCDITYGVVSENRTWKKFRKNSDDNLVFLHKDEFEKLYWSKWLPRYSYPIILNTSDEVQDYNDGFGTNSGMDIFLSTEEMNQIEDTKVLISKIQEKL